MWADEPHTQPYLPNEWIVQLYILFRKCRWMCCCVYRSAPFFQSNSENESNHLEKREHPMKSQFRHCYLIRIKVNRKLELFFFCMTKMYDDGAGWEAVDKVQYANRIRLVNVCVPGYNLYNLSIREIREIFPPKYKSDTFSVVLRTTLYTYTYESRVYWLMKKSN